MDVHEQIRQLDEQKSKLIDDAKTKALKSANQAVAELGKLGFHYELKEGNGKAKKAQPDRKPKDVPCTICGFKTNPPHDQRSHKAQPVKKPFSDSELKERGLTKVQ